jgi:hypothetical protein
MDHNCIYIGFAGSDKHDIILYLARILKHLGKKVLIVDGSETGALMSCIPYPVSLDRTVIDYRGIYFINLCKYNEDLSGSIITMDIDIALIDYGYCMREKDALVLNQIIYVTDQQKHNVDRLIPMADYKNDDKRLVIRDVTGYKYGWKCIINELGLSGMPANNTSIIFMDEVDTRCKLSCQYEIKTNFRKLSLPAKKTINVLLCGIIHDIKWKEIRPAYKKAERGD